MEIEWAWPRLHEGQRVILLDMIVHGSRSRADLARRSGLSRTSLTRLIRDLAKFGLVVEGETTSLPGRGRPAEMLHVVPDFAHLIGIKLTGEALYAVAIDLQARSVAEREIVLRSREVANVVEDIRAAVESLKTEVPRVAGVGVCLAGEVRVDPNGKSSVVGSYFLGWQDEPLQELVEAAVRLPTTVSNDVQALTKGHQWFGLGAGLDSIAVIGYGEGIGAGIVVNGDLVRGAHGHPAKIGHLHVGGGGVIACDQGHLGCVSAFAPLPRIAAAVGAADIDEVFARASAGDPEASAALDSAALALGIVVAHLVNLIDPHLVIITGEGITVAEARSEMITAVTRERIDSASATPLLSLADFRFEDYARGAAVGALQSLMV